MAPAGITRAADLDVARRRAGHELRRAGEPQEFLDGLGHELGLGDHRGALFGCDPKSRTPLAMSLAVVS